MKLTPKNCRTLAWATIVCAIATPFVEPYSFGLGLAFLALLFLAMGMHVENIGKDNANTDKQTEV